MGDNLSSDFFSPEEGIEQAYENYNFLTEDEVTLYNSGGDILYCISVFNMNDIVDKVILTDWFKYWEKIYSNTDIDSAISALQYSEYINLAKIFEPDYSVKKIQDYYDGLSEDDMGDVEDLYVLYNTLRNIDSLGNTVVNELISNKISSIINSDNFVKLDIDVKSTVYGVILARNSGYLLNEEKIKNYIEQIYTRDDSSETIYDRVYYLYYNLILDQLINGYDQNYNASYFQKQIDEMLKTIDYSSQSMAADIISTRRIVEIISDLQIFDVDIKLTTAQKNKIKKGFKEALQEDAIKNSVLFTDIFIVNKILSLDIVSDEELINIYNELTINGGTRAAADSGLVPDIITTFQFYSSLDMVNNYEYLQDQKKFIESLEKNDSIYVLDENSTELDLSVITFGNAIYSYEPGDDKTEKIEP